MDKESDAFLLPKFAYAYKHYCLPSWLRDRRSQRRIGIVNGGMQTSTWDTWKREAQTSIARQEKARGLPQFVGVIGVSRCCARHQSPRLNVGNVAVEYALADVVDGAELTTGDVVVYDLAWAEDPDRKLKSIRYAKNIVLIKGSEEYTGDPICQMGGYL